MPLNFGANESVNQEEGDRLERPNEPPLIEGHTSGSGEGRPEENIELTNTVPTPHDSPLIGEEARQEKERYNLEKALELQRQLDQRKGNVPKGDQDKEIDWNDPQVLRYHALQNKPFSKAEVRKNMIMYLKNQRGYKQSYFKGIKYEDIRPLFERIWDQVHTFVPKDSKIEREVMKKAGFDLHQGSSKKQRKDIAIEAIPLAIKPLVIIKYKIVKEGKISTYHITRADGSTRRYTSMINLLKNIHREDLETLWKLVKDKYATQANDEATKEAMKCLEESTQSHPQKVQEDQGYIDSGCSRHMTGNMSYLSDFKEFDEGYVTFGGGANGGKITGTLTTAIDVNVVEEKVKTVNGEEQIQVLVDKKKVIITETSVRSDLHLEDVEDSQVEGMVKHKEIYITPSHTKKISANMKRQAKDFSGKVTPLFETIMVQPQEDMGEDSEIPTNSHHTPTVTQPSTSSQPQQKQKFKKSKKRIIKGPQLNDSTHDVADGHVTTTSNDPLLSGWNTLRMQVRVIRRIASKQGRMIVDLDADEGVTLVDESHGRNDQDMFDTIIFDDEEVVSKKEVSTADLVSTGGEVVSTAGVKVSTAAITSQISMDEITLAKAIIDIKTSKPMAKGIVMQEPSETPTPTPIYSSQQPSKAKDKGKAKMIGPEKTFEKERSDYD
uniref:Retrovirus-related Pol polyprotein from transposon TNT 1-94-like beta-barrel domain-containing protein n=1 Tax=Tanacetum cinerariifolium TaxID=118510 RepID=A0A6L2JDT0_TANCI|nr:hypothetical protein [Tanacetum cinerariifolium]